MKNYLLLRDNHQSGPYTAENLKKMTLKKFDLIWIEGESFIWKYPSEIKELQRFAPQAELTEATKINSLKEKQMLYFQQCIHEMGYKTIPMSLIDQPDAILNDIPAGFEYMIKAQNAARANAAKWQDETEALISEETVSEPGQMPEHSFDYTVLGEAQIVDTPEVAANVDAFTTTIEMPVRYKRNTTRKPNYGKQRKQIAPGITGLLTLIAMAFINIKL